MTFLLVFIAHVSVVAAINNVNAAREENSGFAIGDVLIDLWGNFEGGIYCWLLAGRLGT